MVPKTRPPNRLSLTDIERIYRVCECPLSRQRDARKRHGNIWHGRVVHRFVLVAEFKFNNVKSFLQSRRRNKTSINHIDEPGVPGPLKRLVSPRLSATGTLFLCPRRQNVNSTSTHTRTRTTCCTR